MRVLVTGNMGYVGPVVIAHLREVLPTATLCGFDSGWFAHCLVGGQPLPERGLDTQLFGDVRRLTSGDLAGFDAVVHLAAVSNDPMGKRFEAVTDEINHQASVGVARAAQLAGVRHFVFASSCSVYGMAEDGRARRETDPVAPLTAYARSKLAAEAGLSSLQDTGMTVTCLRFATACGWAPRLRLDLVLNDFVASALATGEIMVLSDGTPWRPLIHVRDMARAIAWAVGRNRDHGGPCLVANVGSDAWTFRVRDLADAVRDALPGTRVSINAEAPPDPRSYRVDMSLFRTLAPGHQPREDLAATVSELCAGLRAAGFADAAFRQSQFVRLRVLERLIADQRLGEDLRWLGEGSHAVRADADHGRVSSLAQAAG